MSEPSPEAVRPRGAAPMSVTPLPGLPLFQPGMSVAREVAAAVERQGHRLADGDVVVVAQKIVSKSEGRARRLRDVAAGAEAAALAETAARPPALLQLMRDESEAVMRATPMVVIVRHRTGHVAANAGIDASN